MRITLNEKDLQKGDFPMPLLQVAFVQAIKRPGFSLFNLSDKGRAFFFKLVYEDVCKLVVPFVVK